MKPTVGRIVHYWPRMGASLMPVIEGPLAALVLAVDGDNVTLRVFSPRGQPNDMTVFDAKQVLPDPKGFAVGPNWRAGCWDWPPREGMSAGVEYKP
jgi:hypothetical protein